MTNLFALVVSILVSTSVMAADILFVVPTGPGTTTDVMARYLARNIESVAGRTVIVENRAGGDQIIGLNRARTSRQPTLFLGGTTLHVYGHVLWPDALQDLDSTMDMVATVAHSPIVYYTHTNSKIKTLADLHEHLKQNRSLNIGSDLLGVRINPESLKAHYQASNTTVVLYKSSGQTLNDVIGAIIDVGTQTPSPALIGMIQQKRLTVLANSSGSAIMVGDTVAPPIGHNVPQFVSSWFLTTARQAPVDQPVLDAIYQILAAPETKKFLEGLMVTPANMQQAASVEYQSRYREQFRKLAERIDLKK